MLSSIRVVKAFARERYEQERLETASLEEVESALRARSLKARLTPLVDVIVAVGTCLVRNSVRNSSAAPSSSDENSGTERIASSVMAEGLCCDIASTSHDLFIERLNQ